MSEPEPTHPHLTGNVPPPDLDVVGPRLEDSPVPAPWRIKPPKFIQPPIDDTDLPSPDQPVDPNVDPLEDPDHVDPPAPVCTRPEPHVHECPLCRQAIDAEDCHRFEARGLRRGEITVKLYPWYRSRRRRGKRKQL